MSYFKRLLVVFYGASGFIILINLSSCTFTKNTSKSEQVTQTQSAAIVNKYSTLLGVVPSKITNIALYSFIDEWYGTPYKYGGGNKNGIDCSNFTAKLYQEVYSKTITGASGSIFNLCNITSKSNLKEGDLVFFKIEKNQISHIGVYLQNNKFVHATTKKGVMIDDLNTTYYSNYFYKAGCLK